MGKMETWNQLINCLHLSTMCWHVLRQCHTLSNLLTQNKFSQENNNAFKQYITKATVKKWENKALPEIVYTVLVN